MESTTESSEECELNTQIAKLLDTGAMSDVVFLVDHPPKRFACHKLILGMGSPVFRAMFYGKIKERDEIHVPDITNDGFALMLRYLYSGEITIKSEYEAFEAAYASNKYLIKPLFKATENYLLSKVTLDPETVFSLHEEASFLGMNHLRSRCLRYISRNARKLLHSKPFQCASKTTIQDILRLDFMDIESETEIIEAIWRWGQEQCRESDIDCTDENVRSLIKDFLQDVRFLSMKMGDLEGILEKFQLLDTSEQLAVLWNMTMPKVGGTGKVPCNLCEITRTRSVSNCSRIELPMEYRYDGSLSSFLLDEQQTTIEVTVTGQPIIIVGAVVAFKPIPCYSATHRTLDFELSVGNTTSNVRSSVKSVQKAEDEDTTEQLEQELLLDDYVAISEGEKAELTVQIAAEGVRIMQCINKEFSTQCGKACVTFHFKTDGVERLLFPIKEIMCVPS